MAYRILVSLTGIRDGETEAPIASCVVPMASLEEGIAAYRRAVGTVAVAPLIDLGALLATAGRCTASYSPHGAPAVACTRPRGHEAKREKHRGADGREW